MSNEDVLMIYDQAFERWKGLPYEIDELRQVYLMKKLVLQD